MKTLTAAQEKKARDRDLKIALEVRDGVRKEFPKNWKSWTHVVAPRPQEVVHVRKTLRLTQEQFARLFSWGDSTVQAWEQGKRTPDSSASILLKLLQGPARRSILREVEKMRG